MNEKERHIPVVHKTPPGLQERFNALFYLYVEHMHEHRLGVGTSCEGCIELANRQIEAEVEKRRSDV